MIASLKSLCVATSHKSREIVMRSGLAYTVVNDPCRYQEDWGEGRPRTRREPQRKGTEGRQQGRRTGPLGTILPGSPGEAEGPAGTGRPQDRQGGSATKEG